MKTDELIEFLGTNVEPVKGGALRNALVVALAIGAVGALCLMLATLGVPAGTPGIEYTGSKIIALAFSLGLVALGMPYLIGSARPGKPERKLLVLIIVMYFALFAAGVVAFALTPHSTWSGMLFGPQWAACLICIPLFALAPFVSLVWAVRREAPTNLRRTGAIIGLVAGALGAAAFGLHHSGGSVLFITLWYGGSILLCTLIGALLGPQMLRW